MFDKLMVQKQMMAQIGAAQFHFGHSNTFTPEIPLPQRQLVLSQKRYACFHSERDSSQVALRRSLKDVDNSRFLLVSEANGPLSQDPCFHHLVLLFNDFQ